MSGVRSQNPGGVRVMTELSNKTTTSITESLSGTGSLAGKTPSKAAPVRIWAAVGGAILAFQLYVWIRWIAGPNFERVPAGPSDPPTFMKVILVTWTAVIIVGYPLAIYYFIIRPGGGSGASPLTACCSPPAACCSSRIRS